MSDSRTEAEKKAREWRLTICGPLQEKHDRLEVCYPPWAVDRMLAAYAAPIEQRAEAAEAENQRLREALSRYCQKHPCKHLMGFSENLSVLCSEQEEVDNLLNEHLHGAREEGHER